MSRRMAKSFLSLTSTSFFALLIAVSGLVSGVLLQVKKATKPINRRRTALDHQRGGIVFQCEEREGKEREEKMRKRPTSLLCPCGPDVLPPRLWDANGPRRLLAARPSSSWPLCPPLTSKKRKETKERRIMIEEASRARQRNERRGSREDDERSERRRSRQRNERRRSRDDDERSERRKSRDDDERSEKEIKR